MSKAVKHRLRKMEKRTLLRQGALPTLMPDEQAYVDALMEAIEALCDVNAVLLPTPTDEHLSRTGRARVQRFLSESFRQSMLSWEAETGTPFLNASREE